MPRLGGILVAELCCTFLDGHEERYHDVEYLRQVDGCTLILSPKELLFVPWTAIQSLRWRLPEVLDG